MPKYNVTGAVHASTYIGEYDANTPEEAIELAYNDAGVSLCHHCARKISEPEVCELIAEDVETGTATSEPTATNDEIEEQAKEIARLRVVLADIARGDYSDPLEALEKLYRAVSDVTSSLEDLGYGEELARAAIAKATKEKP